MSEALQLSRPLVLLALLLVPLYLLLRRRWIHLDAVPHAPLQYRRGKAQRGRARRWRLPLEAALLGTLVLGLAGPHRETRLELMEDEGVDVMLVLDVSLSMLAEDFPPNRLAALRSIAGDFIRRGGGHRIGIVIFGKDVYVQSPLTNDSRILETLLESVTAQTIDQNKSGGTAIGDALLVAVDRLRAAKLEDRDQAVVLITDGESNDGIDPVLAARFARNAGVHLHAIGIGGSEPLEVFFEGNRVGGDDNPYFAYLDDTQLQEVTSAAGGDYFRASDVGALEQIFAHLSRLESAPIEVRSVGIRHSYTSYLAAVALPLFLAYLLLGGVVLRRPFR